MANLDIVAEAASGESNSAWKKLEARVTVLEERVGALEQDDPGTTPNIKFVQLKDDAAGNDAGWNPGVGSIFFILDSDVGPNSIITATVTPARNPPDPGFVHENGCGVDLAEPNVGFGLGCLGTAEESVLNYMIVAPESEDSESED